MVGLEEVSFGDMVKITGFEPERFKDYPDLLKLINNYRLKDKEVLVDEVDRLNQKIWVLVDGQRVWFDPWDLKKVGAT